ncbi:hypothetical protein BX661DRAFT_198518 [Kickxella alabastrina]|uniref:uncharacterized protein n=1 Tax=Kickxella alabastrina TaxID=61397 RepID=UPI00222070F7|nr:uncharacterized protein BX661DRAFT_198518 [Kickxella alabastrina]KAI7827202.1 hypothetical protein BX661DRAFT_198518 [Kickxella alabastrina]KAJ1936801.1 hypothetical protein GGF37_005461 [Kickxella alabastrina]
MTNEFYTLPTPTAAHKEKRDKVAIIKREVERPRWANTPRIGIVYSAENWSLVEPLVNDLRYELTDNYHFSPINIKITQVESIHEIPMFIGHYHQRSDIVFAIGIALKSSPLFEGRLVSLLNERICAFSVPTRPLVFDLVLVRDDEEQLLSHMQLLEKQGLTMAETWARRAIDACTMLSKTVS